MIAAGILPDNCCNIPLHEYFELLWRTLCVGTHATMREWLELPHLTYGTGFSLRRLSQRPSAHPWHHRITGGRLPKELGSQSPERNESGRQTGCPRRTRINALRRIVQVRFQSTFSNVIKTLKGPRPQGRGSSSPVGQVTADNHTSTGPCIFGLENARNSIGQKSVFDRTYFYGNLRLLMCQINP